ncbi:MAG: hypothetical protein Q4G25_09180 [Paracoccus sp. (in: a-proteobacteria)]|nr:hypothetical protein [Paracoccus sp. (in: a-proteobacteria)]
MIYVVVLVILMAGMAPGWRVSRLRVAVPAAMLVAAIPAVLGTAAMCGVGFAADLNGIGRCSASDTPGEVLSGLLGISMAIAYLGLGLGLFWRGMTDR